MAAYDPTEIENTWTVFQQQMTDLLEALRHAERESLIAEYDRQGSEVIVPQGVPVDAAVKNIEGERAQRVVKILGAAHRAWRSRVVEPDKDGDPANSAQVIDSYIRGPMGGGWSWLDEYVRNGQSAWCGMFAAYCYRSAGIKAAIARKVFPSCYRLYSSWFGSDRYVPLSEVESGDVLVVGSVKPGANKWGYHITIVEDVNLSLGTVNTFEGNAHGLGPDGQRYEGVVKQVRALHGFPAAADLPASKYRGLHAYRPLSGDFED